MGYGGANKPGDVVMVQHLLLDLIVHKKLVGICDDATIEAIRFPNPIRSAAIPDGRIDPDGGTLRAMNKAAGNKPKKTEWIITGTTGLGISAYAGAGIFSGGGGVEKMTLYIAARNDPSNHFKVKCSGVHVCEGIGLGSPVGGSVDYVGESHPAKGEVRRMSKGHDPVIPADFEGVMLMDTVSAATGGPPCPIPNRWTWSTLRTFDLGYLAYVIAVVSAQATRHVFPVDSALHAAGLGFALVESLTKPRPRRVGNLARAKLDGLAKAFAWVAGGGTTAATSAGVEAATAVFRSHVETD